VEFHPTIKPLKLIEYLIRLITPPNGIVLDPFFGTGTTGIASLKQGFRFIGIEISEPYVKTAEHRLEPYLAQQRLIEFDVVIEERDWIGIML
jgi:site-specific DNA-methyltransferase (adenine-specific)